MGYESRIIVVDRIEARPDIYIASELTSIDLSNMGDEEVDGKFFTNLFNKKIDFDLIVDGVRTKTDKYGDLCRFTDIKTVLDWLRESKTAKSYRRAKMALKLLEALKDCESDYENVCLVHYGY